MYRTNLDSYFEVNLLQKVNKHEVSISWILNELNFVKTVAIVQVCNNKTTFSTNEMFETLVWGKITISISL